MKEVPSGDAKRAGLLAPLWELLYPSRCLGCNRRGTLLCSECQPGIPWLSSAVCPRCAIKSVNGRMCDRCQGGARAQIVSTRAACSFDGVVRKAILQLKFRHARYTAPLLADLVSQSLAARPLDAELVIPVPLSSRRMRERGFNQSELIAAALAANAAIPAPSPALLARARDTRPQVGLSAVERRRNILGAFTCPDEEAVAGKRCLLIDDVMTTGATLEACAAALTAAGASAVFALVVAREG